MLLVYPKYYFLPVEKEVRSYEANIYIEDEEIETVAQVKKSLNKDDGYKKLLEEIDEEYINELLAHTG